MTRRLPRAVLAAFVLLAMCLAPGCGRKAKPEPLHPASRISSILTK